MLVSLTVGKVDAGVAVLLTEDKRLIEFPSILLPADISSGSIVDITVARNHAKESSSASAFHSLQTQIFRTFGQRSPSAPLLRCRNATQTSVVLDWDPIDIATAELRSLTLYRNGSKAGTIPKPTEVHSTKLSGLAIDTEYTFHLVLRTSAGTYASEKLKVQTHKMTDLSGITITPGHMPSALRESLQTSAERIGAKIVDAVRIDTTHFVCTEGRGPAWEKAVENNIPVVVPDWIKGCEREGRIVGVRGYYLNADPRLRQLGPGQGQQQQQQQPLPSPRTEITPPTPERATHDTADARRRSSSASSSSSPPPPPPKKDVASAAAAAGPLEPKSQADASREQKARTEDLKPAAPISSSAGGKFEAVDDEDEDDDGEDEEDDTDEAGDMGAGAGASKKANSEALPSRGKAAVRQQPSVEDDEEEEAGFEDVKI